jgi:hypothetical protein
MKEQVKKKTGQKSSVLQAVIQFFSNFENQSYISELVL